MKSLDKMSREEILKVLYKEEKELNRITEDYRKITNKKFKEVKTNYRVDWDSGWFDHWLED
jgi:hypothetical protein